MRRRRLIIAVVVLLAFAAVTAITWRLADWPPPRMILRYGLTPGCEPTGQTMEIEGIEFVEIGPGCFRMGSSHLLEDGDILDKIRKVLGLPPRDQLHQSDEIPVHWVEFRRSFWISRTEVTLGLFLKFDPTHDEQTGRPPADNEPATCVSAESARAFCQWFGRRVGLPVRLPSESEWECAARAGTTTEFWFGDDYAELATHEWCRDNSGGKPHAVASLSPNPWGLFDTHGNVQEWCEDTYHENYHGAPCNGTPWATGTDPAVTRGGDWQAEPIHSRSASRDLGVPHLSPRQGFRLAMALNTP